MIEAIRAVFPQRKLLLRNIGTIPLWRAIVCMATAVIFGLSTAWFLAGGLINDYRVAQNPTVVTTATFNGKCLMQYGIFHSCQGAVTGRASLEKIDNFIFLIYFDIAPLQYDADIVMLDGASQTATLAEGVNKIGQRGVSWVIIVILFIALFVHGLKLARQSVISKKLENTDSDLVPLPLKIGRKRGFWGTKTYTVRYRLTGTEKEKKAQLRMTRREQPFMLDLYQDIALGLYIKGADIPVMLDDRMARLNISDEERLAIRNAALGKD